MTTTTSAGTYKYPIAVILLILQFALGLNWVCVTPLFSIMMDELQIDRATVSLSFIVAPILQAAFTVAAGVLATRVGIRPLFLLGALGMSAGLLMPFTTEYWQMLVLRAIFGLGTCFCGPLNYSIVAQWFRSHELPMMNGFGIVLSSAGITMALLLTVPLSDALGWRNVLGVYGGISAVGAVAWILLGRDGPYGRRSASAEAPAFRPRDVLRHPSTYWVAIGFAGPICYYDVLVGWLPTYYNEVFGMPLADASAITGLLGLAGIPAALVAGSLSARIGLRRPFLIVPGILAGFAGMGTFLFDSPWVILPAVILYGALSWTYTPILFTIPLELPGLSPSLVGVVTGMMLTVAGVTAFISPIAVGYITDRTGSYLPGFFLFTTASFLLLLAALKLPETGPRERQIETKTGNM